MCDNHHDVAAPRIVSLEGMHRRDIVKRLWAGTMLIGVAGTAAGCESAAEFLAPSDSDLVPMAAEAWKETKAQTPISKDAKGNARLQAVGQKIASVAAIDNAQWEFVLFDSPEKNAFCLPGGKVGFYKGLLDFVDNDDQPRGWPRCSPPCCEAYGSGNPDKRSDPGRRRHPGLAGADELAGAARRDGGGWRGCAGRRAAAVQPLE